METLDLEREIPRILAGEIVQKVRYSLKDVLDFAVDFARPGRVQFRLADGADGARARARLAQVIDESLAAFRSIPVKRIWERAGRQRRVAEVAKKLEARGELHIEGPGQVALAGRALALLEYFDGIFAGWGEKLGFASAMYPSLIPAATLDRAEYFNSFPQYLTFAAHLPEDMERIKESIGRFKSGGTAGIEGLDTARQVLSPAVCYHMYPQIADRTLAKLPHRVTARGKCFRYETVNMAPLERQWDFWMRELILVGSPEQVEEFREELLARVKALVTRLDLDGYIESAHDPFFTTEATGKLVLQRLKHLKFELRLNLEVEGKSSAVASFNNHEDFFGRTFAVSRRGGKLAHSGCVAFGLERWVNAFLVQHGLEPRRWPRPVRTAVAGR